MHFRLESPQESFLLKALMTSFPNTKALQIRSVSLKGPKRTGVGRKICEWVTPESSVLGVSDPQRETP